MRLLSTLLCGVLFGTLTSLTAALKTCDQCVKITECAPAMNDLRTNRSPATVKKVHDALCGFDGIQKVCCSDFFSSRSLIEEVETYVQSSGDGIENHRNIGLLPTECGDIDCGRIVGGVTAGLYEFPWLALISYRDAENKGSLPFKCGGTVITSRYVLTAAHCIVYQHIAGVRIGDYDISQKEDCVGEEEIRECETKYQDINVTHTIAHPRYVTRPYVLNDIGLLRLARTVDFTVRNSGSICLPVTKELQDKDLADERGIVAGWGLVNSTTKSNIRLKVELPIFSKTTCNIYYKRSSRSKGIKRMTNTFCAGEVGHDSCKGDSGGPMMIESWYDNTYKFVQYGIMSYGPQQCSSEKPGVYTDVRKFVKWILDTN
uniref:Melanization protease 1 n=1 Tax=Papilio polytes TaxID=76194 RepID=I4DRV5_PAPPL|nr:serine protease easter-like precursor [Papilio polytes]BAM20645.1 melanization protease 1 [Papilio polytes]